MKKASLFLVMLSVMCTSAFSQVKKQYADSTEHGTTVVVKEDGASDLDILNSYGDNYTMGDVIRITTEDVPENLNPPIEEQPLVLAQTAKSKQVAGQAEDTPKRVYKSKPVPMKRAEKPYIAPAFSPQTPSKITTSPSSSPSEFDSSRLHNKKKGKFKKKKRRNSRKLFKGRKASSCYRF